MIISVSNPERVSKEFQFCFRNSRKTLHPFSVFCFFCLFFFAKKLQVSGAPAISHLAVIILSSIPAETKHTHTATASIVPDEIHFVWVSYWVGGSIASGEIRPQSEIVEGVTWHHTVRCFTPSCYAWLQICTYIALIPRNQWRCTVTPSWTVTGARSW